MPPTVSDQRHYGIELLRIVAMLMICVIHVNSFVVFGRDQHQALHYFSYWLEGVGIIGVNLYALTTGYVCVNTQWKFSRIVRIWGLVIFYAFLITLSTYLLFRVWGGAEQLSLKESIKTFFRTAVAYKCYWYLSAYVGVFFLSPFLNRAIKAADKMTLKWLLLALLAFYPLLNSLFPGQMYAGGYNFVWLVVLYVAGAYLKLHPLPMTASGSFISGMCRTPVLLGVSLLCSFQFILWHVLELVNSYSYVWPVYIIYSCALFVVFSRIHIQDGMWLRVIKWVAPTSFSVYLIHVHPLSKMIYSKAGALLLHNLDYPWWFSLGFGLLIFIACSLIDRVRIIVYRFCRIEQFWNHVAGGIEKWGTRILTPFIRE